jgi:recombinational DNA repair protein RecR
MRNLIEKLKEKNILYFVLASLISSDSNISIEEINNNMKSLQSFKDMILEANLEQEEKEKLLNICNDGVKILKKDLLTFGGK